MSIKLDLPLIEVSDGFHQEENPLRGPSLTKQALSLAPETLEGAAAWRQLCHSPSQTMFRNEQEHRYFKVFSNKTASQLAGHLDTDLWKRLVL